MSWFSNQWSKWARDENGSSSSEIRRIEVVWGRERLQIVLPRSSQPPTLADLKEEIAAITSVPYEQIKLVVGGLVMKQDAALLSKYGLRDGSRVMLIGTAGGIQGDTVGQKESSAAWEAQESAAALRKQKESDQSEAGLLRRIGEAVNGVKTELLPEVEQLERSVKALEVPAEAEPANGGEAEDGAASAGSALPLLQPSEIPLAHRKLSELLLRSLLTLDSVQVNSETTRTTRKAAVKDVQGLLDRVDAAWTTAKALGVKAA